MLIHYKISLSSYFMYFYLLIIYIYIFNPRKKQTKYNRKEIKKKTNLFRETLSKIFFNIYRRFHYVVLDVVQYLYLHTIEPGKLVEFL